MVKNCTKKGRIFKKTLAEWVQPLKEEQILMVKEDAAIACIGKGRNQAKAGQKPRQQQGGEFGWGQLGWCWKGWRGSCRNHVGRDLALSGGFWSTGYVLAECFLLAMHPDFPGTLQDVNGATEESSGKGQARTEKSPFTTAKKGSRITCFLLFD